MIFKRSKDDGIAAARRLSTTYSSCKDRYAWYFVLEGLEKGVEAQCSTVLRPDPPCSLGGGGSTHSDSGGTRFLFSAQSTDETNSSVGCQT